MAPQLREILEELIRAYTEHAHAHKQLKAFWDRHLKLTSGFLGACGVMAVAISIPRIQRLTLFVNGTIDAHAC